MKTNNSITLGKKDKPRNTAKIALVIFCVGLVIFCNIIFLVFLKLFVFPTRTMQILYSPKNTHKAVLKRLDGIDLVFFVIVDGKKVYSSPDFAPNHRVDFRERIRWDKNGDIVILEVTGRRLFGYNAQTGKSLSDSELLLVEYAPEPNESEYGFEGTWPDERVKHSPEATEK